MINVRALATKVVNLCVRAVVTRSGERYQAQWLGDRTTPPVENFQPQGLHFRVPVGAEHLLLSPCGETSAAIMLGAHVRSGLPTDTLAEGEGGLHYLGTYGVYLKANGEVHLGGGVAATDFVALATKTEAALDKIQKAFDAHTHVVTGAVPAVTTPVVIPPATQAVLVPIGDVGSVAASKVKAT